MPSKEIRFSPQQLRDAIQVLDRDRLTQLTEQLGLDVEDRRVTEHHIHALLVRASVDFATLLGRLKREELQLVCDALRLDRGGREKEVLIQRILTLGQARQVSLELQPPPPPAEARENSAPVSTKPIKKTGGDLGFESTLWKTADELRGNMDAAEYKHVVLGLIFLKYVSDAFEERHAQLLAEVGEGADPEDPDEYRAENVFWVPKEARWPRLMGGAKQPDIGKHVDEAMAAIERDNTGLKGVLPKDYTRPGLDKKRLGSLIDLISTIGLGDQSSRSKDILGRVYEYFLSEFASAEGKKGGQFYTPKCVVKLLVEMLAPYQGRVFDPCCGSGGMFVQSEKFVQAHGGRIGDLSIFGQESNVTTWRLAKMNLAIRGIDANLGESDTAGSFLKDHHPDLKADFVLANPPFNDSAWSGEQLREDKRWKYGVPPAGNANFAWVQHFIHHLSPTGMAGFVLANGSMSSNQSGEGTIRKAIIEADLVDCIVSLPGQLFYSTQIPVCLWFLAREKKNARFRDRRGETLFIDARKMGQMISRTQRELTDPEITQIAEVYRAWRGGKGTGHYEDRPGFCKGVHLAELVAQDFVLTPGRYVGTQEAGDEAESAAVRLAQLTGELAVQFREANQLETAIRTNLQSIGLWNDR